jgi:hypothetical protein
VQKICFEKSLENPEGQGLKRLGSAEIERPSAPTKYKHNLTGRICVTASQLTLLGCYAADADSSHQNNVILWAFDRAPALYFS